MLNDYLNGLKESFAPGCSTELRAQLNRTRGVGILDGVMSSNSRSDVQGVSARVYKNGVYGFSSMAENSRDAGVAVLKAATENADFMDSHIKKGNKVLPPLNKGTEELRFNVDDAEQKKYVELAKEVDDYIGKHYTTNLKSKYVGAREDSREKILYTSDGYDAHTVIQRSTLMFQLTAETKDGKPVDVFDGVCELGGIEQYLKDKERIYKKIDELYKRLMDKREGVYAEAGYKTVILDGMMTGMLSHEAVGHTVEGDLVLGGSVAGPNLNKMVASEKVSLVDFAHTAFGKQVPLPVYVDEEGTLCEDATIIDHGKLVGYMNSRTTADSFGMKPQGNARAYNFSDEPLVRMRNTSILPGTDKLSDMIASVEDGYYLIQSGNGQADLTGEFIFGVTTGYEIKNGKLGRALLDTTVSGVAFDMLKSVDMVSDEVVWSAMGTCGKKQPMPVSMGGPALRCKIMIGGR